MDPVSGGMKVAIYIITVCFVYIFMITFAPMPPSGLEHSKTVVGFLMGTVFSTLLNYYWGGSSKRKQSEDSATDDEAKRVAAELEEKRIEAAKEDVETEEEARIKTAEEAAAIVIQEASIKAQRGEAPDDPIIQPEKEDVK